MTTDKAPNLPKVPPDREHQPSANPNQAVTLRLSNPGSHTVDRGKSYQILPFGDLLDINGVKVPGSGNWTLATPITGVTVGNNQGYLNGIVNIASVTSNMSITARLTPLDYPNLAKSLTFSITVRG